MAETPNSPMNKLSLTDLRNVEDFATLFSKEKELLQALYTIKDMLNLLLLSEDARFSVRFQVLISNVDEELETRQETIVARKLEEFLAPSKEAIGLVEQEHVRTCLPLKRKSMTVSRCPKLRTSILEPGYGTIEDSISTDSLSDSEWNQEAPSSQICENLQKSDVLSDLQDLESPKKRSKVIRTPFGTRQMARRVSRGSMDTMARKK